MREQLIFYGIYTLLSTGLSTHTTVAPHKTVLFSGTTTVVSVSIVVLGHYCGLRRISYKWHTEHKSLKNPQSQYSIQKFNPKKQVAKKGSVTDE